MRALKELGVMKLTESEKTLKVWSKVHKQSQRNPGSVAMDSKRYGQHVKRGLSVC